MEIRYLITFVRLTETLNFSKTAAMLGYSQSAVTMQIKQIEDELGVQIFERFGKHVSLSPAGEKLLPYALEIINSVQLAKDSVNASGSFKGKVRLGTCESFVISVLPEIFIEFGKIYPKAEVSVSTAETDELFAKLRRNEVDVLYFLDRKIYCPDWIKIFERPVKFYFVASPSHHLARAKNIPLKKLVREPLVLTERGISYRYAVEQVFAERGIELHPFLEIGNTEIITRFVSEGRGISFLPEYVIADGVNNGTLAILDTDCPEITMWSQLAYHQNKFVSPQLKCLIDIINSEAQI